MSWQDESWRRWLLAVNLTLLFAAVVWCRAAMLDRVPGLNGDEAWQGVQVQEWLRGQSVSWRTPTGNPINPLMFFPLAALHVWMPPSIVLLRLTTLFSGLLALAVNYVLCRRLCNARVAVISTVMLAVLPVTMAYSRFAWDASQSLLVTLPVAYCSLGAMHDSNRRNRWIVGAVVALLLAIWVHPTNVFLAPMVVVTAAWSWRDTLTRWGQRLNSKRAICVTVAILVLVAGSAGFVAMRYSNHAMHARILQGAERLASPLQAGVFSQRYVDLLSGTTVYRYLAASQLDSTDLATLTYRGAAWALVLMAAYGLWREVQRRKEQDVIVLLIGFGTSMAAFYVVAGPGAIQPHFERYGMWMIAPSCWLLATGLAWWTEPQRLAVRLRPAVAALVAWGLLAGFGWYYFRPLLTGKNGVHVAFRTADVEPKLAALRYVQKQQATKSAQIAASGWWLYWPLKYLAGSDPRLIVIPEGVPTVSTENASDGGAWRVMWCNGDAAKAAAIVDAAGQPLVRIVPPARNDQNAPATILP